MEHDDGNRPSDRRALDAYRLGKVERGLEAMAGQLLALDDKIDAERAERLAHEKTLGEQLATLPIEFVPRAEHQAGKAQLWQVVVAAAAVAGLAVQVAAQLLGH